MILHSLIHFQLKKELNINQKKYIIVGNNKYCFIPLFIRKRPIKSSHWLLIFLDKSFELIQVYVIDSFNHYFTHKKTLSTISMIIDAFKDTENFNKEVTVSNVKILDQLTYWECGYRMIKVAKILTENNFNINSLSTFDYADFINNFVPQIAENQIDFK